MGRDVDGIFQHKRPFGCTPAEVQDLRPVVDRVEDAGGEVVFLQERPALGESKTRSDWHYEAVRDAGDADPVVGDGPYDAGYLRAVARLVERVVVRVDVIPFSGESGRIGEVPPTDVVDVAVSVVVDVREARGFSLIDPDIVSQVLVGVVDAGVDNADDDATVWRTECFPECGPSDPVEWLLTESGVVWLSERGEDVIGLRVEDVGALSEQGSGLLRRVCGRIGHTMHSQGGCGLFGTVGRFRKQGMDRGDEKVRFVEQDG